MTNPDFRATCAELVAAWESYSYGDAGDATDRMTEAVKAARALLAEPEPEGPSDEELDELYFYIDARHHVASWRHYARAVLARWGRSPQQQANAAGEVAELVEGLKLISDGMSAIGHESDSWFVARAADLLERLTPQPEGGDIHYAWELHDDEGDWQAGGSAITLESVRREGGHYLQIYSQDGPHTLIIQRVSTIEEVTND